MQPYDLPSTEINSQPAHNVFRHRRGQGKVLRFVAWQSCVFAIAAYALTYLRYRGLLEPLIAAARARFGL